MLVYLLSKRSLLHLLLTRYLYSRDQIHECATDEALRTVVSGLPYHVLLHFGKLLPSDQYCENLLFESLIMN